MLICPCQRKFPITFPLYFVLIPLPINVIYYNYNRFKFLIYTSFKLNDEIVSNGKGM